MTAWTAAWFSLCWLLGGLFIGRLVRNLADVRALLERAEADLHHGPPRRLTAWGALADSQKSRLVR